MKLFIRIVDGMPFEHPIIEENFCQVFPDVDINNLPPEFARFERIELPRIKPYEVYEGTTYELDKDCYKDVHHIRSMTDEERAIKINQMMDYPHPDDWIFSEERCEWVPQSLNTGVAGSAPNVIG